MRDHRLRVHLHALGVLSALGVDAEGGEDAECVEMDSEAMVAQGLDAEALAEAYLRAVAERVATSVEPARLEAIDKWIKERKQRRTLQDQLQASLSLSHTHKSRTHTSPVSYTHLRAHET